MVFPNFLIWWFDGVQVFLIKFQPQLTDQTKIRSKTRNYDWKLMLATLKKITNFDLCFLVKARYWILPHIPPVKLARIKMYVTQTRDASAWIGARC